MNQQATLAGFRHARMPIRSVVLMMRGAEMWSSDLEDISSTGVLVQRPGDWAGSIGQNYVLDMLVGEEINIHVEAAVTRITPAHVGFAFTRIPADKEVPLWDLLGGYADHLEQFSI
jgi:hypothetical protein